MTGPPPMVGREEQLRVLARSVRHVREGSAGIALVHGPGGVGKTRLAEAVAADWAAANGTVLNGRGTPVVGRNLPLGLWGQLLGPNGSPRGRTFDALTADVARFLRETAQARPLLLVLDDLQWADRSSLELLDAVWPYLGASPVLLLCLLRDDADLVNSPVARHLPEWWNTARTDLTLGELDEPSVAALVVSRGLSSDPSLVQELMRRTGGNPFLLLALLDADERDEQGTPATPSFVLDLLAARAASADPLLLPTLRLAALHGSPLPLDVAAECLAATDEEVDSALRAGERSRLLTRDTAGISPVHDLIAESALLHTGPLTTRELHRRLAAACDARPALEHGAALRAAHWIGAGDSSRARQACIDAAREAEGEEAFAEEWTFWKKSLDLDPEIRTRPEEQARAAVAAYLAGCPRDAVLVQEDIVRKSTGDDRTLSMLRLATFQRAAGEGRSAFETIAAAHRESQRGTSRVRSEAAAALAAALLARGDYRSATTAADEVMASSGAPPSTLSSACTTRGVADALCGDLPSGLVYFDRALGLAEGDHEAELRALNNRCFVLMDAGSFGPAADDARRGLELARRRHVDRGHASMLLANLVECLTWTGRWDEALTEIQDGLGRQLLPEIEAGLLACRARILGCRGDPINGELDLARSLNLVEGSDDAGLLAQITVVQAELHLQQGSPGESLAPIDAALARLERASDDVERLPLLTLGTIAAAAAGTRHEAARAWTARWPPDRVLSTSEGARRTGVDIAWFATLTAAAVPAGTQEKTRNWLAAADAWVEADNPWWQGQSLLGALTGQVRLRRSKAPQLVQSIRAIAAELGSPTLREAADAIARRARLEPLTSVDAVPTTTSPLGLTPREHQVLEGLVAGWSNRIIAQHLFISARTVELHVTRVLSKLQVASRAEAAALARELDLLNGHPTEERS